MCFSRGRTTHIFSSEGVPTNFLYKISLWCIVCVLGHYRKICFNFLNILRLLWAFGRISQCVVDTAQLFCLQGINIMAVHLQETFLFLMEYEGWGPKQVPNAAVFSSLKTFIPLKSQNRTMYLIFFLCT